MRVIFAIITGLACAFNASLLLQCLEYGHGQEYLNPAFKSLAENLLRGSAEVGWHIGFEGIEINKKVYMYFGLFPALIRILLSIFNEGDLNHLTFWSFLLADTCLIVFFASSLGLILKKTESSKRNIYTLFACLLVIGLAIASPLLILQKQSIYNESILWATTLVQIQIYCVFKALFEKHTKINIFLIAMCASLAFLSRVTFGVSAMLIALTYCCYYCKKLNINNTNLNSKLYISKDSMIALLITLLTLAIGVSIQFQYNNARFQDSFKFFDWESYRFVKNNPKGLANIQEYGEFNIKRIPAAIKIQFLPTYTTIHTKPLNVKIAKSADSIFFTTDSTLPFPLLALWLFIGGIVGLSLIFKQKDYHLLLFVAPFALQSILILSFASQHRRYSAEFLPLFSFLTIYLFWIFTTTVKNRATILFCTLILCTCVTFSSLIAATVHLTSCQNSCRKTQSPHCLELFWKFDLKF